jgi:hypothetical protein
VGSFEWGRDCYRDCYKKGVTRMPCAAAARSRQIAVRAHPTYRCELILHTNYSSIARPLYTLTLSYCESGATVTTLVRSRRFHPFPPFADKQKRRASSGTGRKANRARPTTKRMPKTLESRRRGEGLCKRDLVQDRLTDRREHQESDNRNPKRRKGRKVNHDQEPPKTLPTAAPEDAPPATGTGT